jgi:hypothetical protein
MMPTGAEKRRAVITDLLIGLGIPILQMVLREYTLGDRLQPSCSHGRT